MKRKERGLFFLLAQNYLLFTVTLFLITGGVYFMWDGYVNSLYEPDDWDGLFADEALTEGNYKKLRRYLNNRGSAFAVLDASGNVQFSSDAGFLPDFTEEELSFVREYDTDTELETFYDYDENGEISYLIIASQMDEEGLFRKTADVVLDKELCVVSGGLHQGKQRYTQKEYAILSGNYPGEGNLYRYEFLNKNGERKTLLLRMSYLSDSDFYRLYDESWRIWLLFIPLYILAAGLFIGGIRQKIRKPLMLLQRAVEEQYRGRYVSVGDCGGPQEIQRIAKSFDLLSARLYESEQERKRLDEGRQKMLADISHDLKTPVTVIAGYVNALCDGKVPKGQEKNYMEVIRSRTEGLTELIHAFYEYSKVEHPRFAVAPEPVDVCEYLRGYLAGKYDEIGLAGFSLEVSIPEASVYCSLDKFQFGRVLDNLLSNSLRHNRLGTVLFVDVRQEEGQAVIVVADNGQGILKERRDTVFEPFVVGNEARGGGRSGLGLTIVRRIVLLHGGTVELAEHPGEGRSVEFVVKLPVCGSK